MKAISAARNGNFLYRLKAPGRTPVTSRIADDPAKFGEAASLAASRELASLRRNCA